MTTCIDLIEQHAPDAPKGSFYTCPHGRNYQLKRKGWQPVRNPWTNRKVKQQQWEAIKAELIRVCARAAAAYDAQQAVEADKKARADANRATVQLRAIGELLPTPKGSDGEKGGPNQRGSSGDYALPAISHLLPTPAANDSGNTPEEHLRKKPGRTQVTSLQVIADHGLIETGGKILPTPTGGNAQRGGDRGNEKLLPGLAVEMTEKDPAAVNWGAYAPAIRRWERVLGRQAPSPTIPIGKNGAQRLNPAFVEWMMGLTAGHVTDVDIPRSAMLKALGNGVCPQQAVVAKCDDIQNESSGRGLDLQEDDFDRGWHGAKREAAAHILAAVVAALGGEA